MMKRLLQNHRVKAGIASFLLDRSSTNYEERITKNGFGFIEKALFFLLLLFLPTQFGKHFWPDFSIISGIRVDYLSPTFYFTDILVGLLLVAWVINKAKSEKRKAKKIHVKSRTLSFTLLFFVLRFKFFVGSLLFLLVNIFFSGNILNGLYHLLKFLEFSFVAYYVAKAITNRKQYAVTLLVLAVGVVGESLLAVAQFVHQGSLGGPLYWLGERSFLGQTPGIANATINGQLLLRPYGTFPHPNVLAGFLLCSMLLLFFSFPKVKARALKLLYATSLLLGTAALILTLSRVAIALWILVLLTSFIKTMRKSGFIFLLLASCFLLLAFSPLGSRFFQTSLSEEAVVQRQALIVSSLKLFKEHPLLGVGFGNFLPSLGEIARPQALGLYLQPVHNIFLIVVVETGLVGFFFFLWFLAKTYKKLIAFKQYSLLVVLSIVLLLGLNDHYWLTLQQGQLLFAFLLGLCWARTDA